MRQNFTITITAPGTPINIFNQQTVAQPYPYPGPFPKASVVFIQMADGAQGIGKVYDGVSGGRVPVAGDLTAELAPSPGAGMGPGGSYTYSDPYHGIPVNEIWIDGTHAGDVILVSWVPLV